MERPRRFGDRAGAASVGFPVELPRDLEVQRADRGRDPESESQGIPVRVADVHAGLPDEDGATVVEDRAADLKTDEVPRDGEPQLGLQEIERTGIGDEEVAQIHHA